MGSAGGVTREELTEKVLGWRESGVAYATICDRLVRWYLFSRGQVYEFVDSVLANMQL